MYYSHLWRIMSNIDFLIINDSVKFEVVHPRLSR